MTFLVLNILILLVLHLYFLLKDTSKISPRAVRDYKELKEEHGDDAYSHIKFGIALTQVIYALILFWEIIILVHLAINQYFIYVAIFILVLSIWSFFKMISYFPKKMKEYLENPGDKVFFSFWEVFRSKVTKLIEVLFYAAVLAKTFGFDISQYI